MKLGALLALSRELKGWSQRKLAAESGVNHAIIAQMESGQIKQPSWWKVVRLARALGVNLDRIAECEKL